LSCSSPPVSAIIHGTLYLSFSSYPIFFQVEKAWNTGAGGLAFLGVMIGVVRLSLTFARGHQPELGQDGQTQRGAEPIPKTDCSPASTLACSSSSVWPDSRRPMAGTSPIIFGAPFGCGIVVVFLAVLTYLVDSYTVYVASVLAANSVVRSLFGAAFPL